MNRRLIVTLATAIALGACGMPEDGELEEYGSDVQELQTPAVHDPALEQQAAPGAGQPTFMVVGAVPPANTFIVTGANGGPGGTVSSTQDPIPTKNRRDYSPLENNR